MEESAYMVCSSGQCRITADPPRIQSPEDPRSVIGGRLRRTRKHHGPSYQAYHIHTMLRPARLLHIPLTYPCLARIIACSPLWLFLHVACVFIYLMGIHYFNETMAVSIFMEKNKIKTRDKP